MMLLRALLRSSEIVALTTPVNITAKPCDANSFGARDNFKLLDDSAPAKKEEAAAEAAKPLVFTSLSIGSDGSVKLS